MCVRRHRRKSEKAMLYFAYGSNMCTRRLRYRVPSATAVATATLDEHELRFHKLSADDSGKCDAYSAGEEGEAVYGVVFEIHPQDKGRLDRCEGLGSGYLTKTVRVASRDGPIEAFTYYADPGAIRPHLLPYTWYRDFVVAGAEEHRLPAEYVEWLRSFDAKEDPDPDREFRERNQLPPDDGVLDINFEVQH